MPFCCILRSQSVEIPHTKTITSSWLDAKRVKMAEKLQKRGKEVLKRLVKQRKGKVSKTARILSENGRLETFAKNGSFPTKTGGLESLAFLRGWHCACWSRLTVDCSSVYDDNDDYQWLPAEFRNWFSFGNVCCHRLGSRWTWGTARLGFFSFERVDVEKGFFTQQLFHNPYSGQIFWC